MMTGGVYPLDRQIHVRTAGDVASFRPEAVSVIFGGSLPSEVGALETFSTPVAGLTGVATCQRIVMTGYTARPVVWTPTSPSGKLVILHQGHSGSYNSLNYAAALQSYLSAGHTVCGMVMPGGVDTVTSGTSASHIADKPALSVFIGPVIVAINTLIGAYPNVFMTGLSGGGWTTTLAAALDTRIAKSFPTAGSLPLDRPSSRDHEQYLPGLSLSYLDLYILGAAGRYQKQILHTTDEVCFSKAQHDTGRPYADEIKAISQGLGGDFDLVWKDKTAHEFDAAIIASEILPHL